VDILGALLDVFLDLLMFKKGIGPFLAVVVIAVVIAVIVQYLSE
jgi:uncharacterized membrane protein (DUF106 family)